MRVLISGAGIGGLATAIALGQRGHECVVLEKSAELAPTGTGIGLGPNALRVLEALGVADAVEARSAPIDAVLVRRSTGQLIHHLRYQDTQEGCGRALHRTDLQTTLRAPIDRSTLRLGAECVSYTQDAETVTAQLADGSSESGDVLVGADGIHSSLRRQLHPHRSLRSCGQTCWRGVAEYELPTDQRRSLVELWGGRDRFGYAELGAGRVYWYAVTISPPGPQDSIPVATARLANLCARFVDPCADLVQATDPETVIQRDLYDLKPGRRWHEGRVCLIGDAAHATTPNLGQGGCQALEDALALALSLERHPVPTVAFRHFERARYAKVRFVVNHSRRIGRVAHLENRAVRRLVELLLRCLPDALERRQVRRIMDLSYLDRI